MKIELPTMQEVPALLNLQRKAFDPLCEELSWKDAPRWNTYKSEEMGTGWNWVYLEKD